jgi:predicted nucleic acid-binding protein
MATRIAVTDANIFIDVIFMEIEGILPDAGFMLHTTRQVMDELNEEQSGKLSALIALNRLLVHDISGGMFDDFSNYFINKGLSLADHSVLFMAERMDAIVISGDGLVRKICLHRKMEVHGILWLLNECVTRDLLTKSLACERLSALMLFNPRLPLAECNDLLHRWATR